MENGNRIAALLIAVLLVAGATAPAQDEALKKAVQAGIDWLIRHQDPEGRWSSAGFSSCCPKKDKSDIACEGPGQTAHDAGVTGLALLALLATPLPKWAESHQNAVNKGLAWLVGQQAKDGCYGERIDHRFNYDHAVATRAMAEAHGVLRADAWKESAGAAVKFCLAVQNPSKAWRYGIQPGDNDMSLTAWMVSALAAGRKAGLDVPEEPFRWALAFVDEVTDGITGRTGYTKKGEFPVRSEGLLNDFPGTESESLTAAGICTRLLCGEEPLKNQQFKRSVDLLVKKTPLWKVKSGRTDFVYWYYGTQALAAVRGPYWNPWRKALLAAVVPAQEKSGCRRGSWPPSDPWGSEGGRIYSTSLLTLCLAVCVETPPVSGK